VRFGSLCWLAVSLSWGAAAHAEPEAEIVVAGHKSTRPTRDLTLAASVVDTEQLRRPGADAATVLSHLPGVQVSETGSRSELSTASVRGASSAQTPVYLAGIRLNDDVTGTADLSLIPLWMLGRAEVYRGNAPADADHLGIGGAVYFEPRVPRKNRLLAGAELGSFGERAGWLGAEVAERHDAALVAFRTQAAKNDYPYLDIGDTVSPNDDHVGTRPNADASERDAWAISRTTLGPRGARVTSVFNAFQREQGVSGLAARPALSARGESARVLAGLSARLPCGGEPGCELALASQVITARARLTDPGAELGLLAPRLDSRGTRFGESARLTISGPVVQALIGANFEVERLSLDGGSSLRAARSTSSARVGVSASLNERTELSALGLVSCDLTRGAEQRSGCADLTPEGRLGVRQKWGTLELRGHVARSVRVPTLGELYGISASSRGSSGLLPERAVAFDLGLRWEAPLGPLWTYLELFGFARHVSELIAFRRSSLGAVQPYNVGTARVLGAELEAGAQLADSLRALLALTVLDPRDTTPERSLRNDLIPYQARLVGSLFVEGFVDPGLRPLGRLGLDARLSHRASRLADPAALEVLPASSTVDVGASLRAGQDSAAALRCAVDDLFDSRHLDFIGYPVPGRRTHCSVEVEW